MLLPYDPTVVLLGIYPNELKTYVHTKNCTRMFIAALFIITKSWKPPRCPSVDEWINNLWSIQTLEYYSALKRNELSSHEEMWRKLKCLSPSERSHFFRLLWLYDSSYMTLRRKQSYRDGRRSVTANGWMGMKVVRGLTEHRGFLRQ